MKKLVVLVMVLSGFVFGCAFNLKPIDVNQVQSNVVKGKTTIAEIENMYGTPYNKGISKDGNTYYYYLSANPFSGSSQDFTFYFDNNGKVSNYASEYPGGNPLLK
jgi:hypothetical protein